MENAQIDVAATVTRLLQSVQSLQLATLCDSGVPLASYAPFVHIPQQGFLIFVSELARHTRNMCQRPETSALVIADEGASRQMFARERIEFECQAKFISRRDDVWEGYVDHFEEKFGAVLKLLRGMADFNLVALNPVRGVYVRGFGEAWSFQGSGLDMFQHISSELLKQNSAGEARAD